MGNEYQKKLFWFFAAAMMSVAFIIMVSGYVMSKNSTIQKMEQSALQELALKKEILQRAITQASVTLELSKRPHIVSLLQQPYEVLSCATEFFYLGAAHLGDDLTQMHYIDVLHKRVVHIHKDTRHERLYTEISNDDFEEHMRDLDRLILCDSDKLLALESLDCAGEPTIQIATTLWDDEANVLGIISLDLNLRQTLKTVMHSEMFDVVLLDGKETVISSSIPSLLVAKNASEVHLFQALTQKNGMVWDEGYVYASDTLLKQSGLHITIMMRSKDNLSEITRGITQIFAGIFCVIFLASLLLSSLMSRLHTSLLNKIITREELILQEGKLIEIGGMVSYLAHQWKQPINRIATHIACAKGELLHVSPLKPEVLLNDLNTAELELEEMSEHIESFRSFYRFSKEKEHFGVEKELRHVAQMLSYALHMQKISLHVTVEPKEIELYGLKNEWKHVIVSLLNNAIEAFKSLGEKEDAAITVHVTQDTHMVHIAIRDNAGGMDPSMYTQLFSKYASSKQETGGTGLGLYFAKIIIQERFHGSIRVMTHAKGTHFSLALPMRAPINS